ncbi:hypothetical protein COY27_03380 [Candidatus Woesearchaeota archaeon CG_4_10_14_0_2_um_filter_33_13]|nr:MAG: hypothetical protein COY27_03380 [Candidatus Woesearchaeota archaeon CG_4_10_14_0_2_um_filter_33_13]
MSFFIIRFGFKFSFFKLNFFRLSFFKFSFHRFLFRKLKPKRPIFLVLLFINFKVISIHF